MRTMDSVCARIRQNGLLCVCADVWTLLGKAIWQKGFAKNYFYFVFFFLDRHRVKGFCFIF